jgi:hypothetical protein
MECRRAETITGSLSSCLISERLHRFPTALATSVLEGNADDLSFRVAESSASLCFHHFPAALIEIGAFATPLQQAAHSGDALHERVQFGNLPAGNERPALRRPAAIVEKPSRFFERETAIPEAPQDSKTAED